MDPLEYLRAIRRRWVVVVSALAIALGLAWVTTTVAPVGLGPPTRSYEATTVLFSLGLGNFGNSGFNNLNTIASLTTIPNVAKRVATDIHYTGDPATLSSQIRAAGDPQTGLLNITATSPQPEQARLLAEKFSVELLVFLKEQASSFTAAEAAALSQELNRLKGAISKLDGQIANTPLGTEHDLLEASRNANVITYSSLSNQYQQLASQSAAGGLVVIQNAVPQLVVQSGFQAPRSKKSRFLVAAVVGLIMGIALALVLERFDTRIRNKKAAEKSFGFPVLAEIPLVPRMRRWRLGDFARWRSGRVPVVMPAFPRVGDAFRLLGAGVTRAPLDTGNGDVAGTGNGHRWALHPSGVILVTSAGPDEGKTTVVANLALTFVQAQRSVIVLSCDFQHPQIHKLFDVPNTDGLADALQSQSQGVLNGHIKPTPVRDMRLVPSGARPKNPAGLFSSERMRQAVEEARREADIVLIDTPPLLTSAEITHLFPFVDAVVVVARAKRTTQELAERAGELLKRLDAPAVGVALNGATEVPLPRDHQKYWQVIK